MTGWENFNSSPPAPVAEPSLIPLEIQEAMKADGYSPDKDGLLMFWQAIKANIEKLKATEMDVRKLAVKLLVEKPVEGMNTVELGNGYKLKAGVKYNYNLLDNNTVESCLARIAKVGNQGSFIAERLVSWTPSFLLTEYRALQEDESNDATEILKIVNEMLVITDAAPTLEIKEPKKK